MGSKPVPLLGGPGGFADDADVAVVAGFAEAELMEGVECGLLLGLLFGLAPAGAEAAGADLDGDLEALGVVGALLVEDEVLGGGVEVLLGVLLEDGLEVLLVAAGLGAGDELGEDGLEEGAGGVHAAVEVAGGPLAPVNELGPTASTAVFGNNSGLIVGEEIAGGIEGADALRAEVLIGGQSVGVGSAAKLPGGIAAAVAVALSMAVRLGRPLKAGQWVSTGALTGVHSIAIGQQARITFTGSFSRAPPRCFSMIALHIFSAAARLSAETSRCERLSSQSAKESVPSSGPAASCTAVSSGDMARVIEAPKLSGGRRSPATTRVTNADQPSSLP